MAAANEKETAALKMFRHRIADVTVDMDDYQKHDQSLLRFLRARDLNLDRAEDMLRKHLQWRKDEDIDNVRNVKLPEFIEQSYRFKVSGFDRQGSLVAVVQLGTWDVKKIAESQNRQDMYTYIVQIFEQAMAFLKHRSTKEECHTQINLLIDFKDFSFKQIASRAVIELAVDVLSMFEQNYPEILKTCWIVNAPTFFQVIYKLIKSLLSAHTMSKIKIFASNAEEWHAALLSAIDVDQLPSSHGGSITTVVDYKMEYGFDVFPKYDTIAEDEMKSVTVLPGQKFSVDLHDIDVGTQIMWNFKTESYNIGFSLCMGENEVLVPSCKTDAHLHTQKGMWYCEKAGKYTLVFDNSFSKWRGKQLKYAVAMKNPNKFIM